MSRILIVVLLGLAMLGLVVVSQLRTAPNYVSGILEAEEIRLGSRVGGRVSEVHVSEGETVTRMQPLIEFEPFDLLEREQQALGVLAEKEANLQKISSGFRPEEIDQAKLQYDEALAQLSLIQEGPRKEEIAAAENRVEAAKADLNLASREYDRQANLAKTNAASRSEFDVSEEKFKVASATVKVRENELAILKAGSRQQQIEIAQANAEKLRLAWELAKQGFRTEEIEQAEAARDAARAALEAIRKQKAELSLVSPAAGTIDSLDLHPGDLVAPNAPVLTLLSDGDLWVRAYIPQRLLKVQIGQKLRITLDSFPDEEFEGEITFISQQAEFTPSNVQTPDDRAKQVYRVRVTLVESKQKLRPGMTANVWLDSLETPDE
jgi:HlyD family secretion protein